MTNVPLYTVYFVYRLYKAKKKANELKRNKSYALAPTDEDTEKSSAGTDEKEKEDLIIVKF